MRKLDFKLNHFLLTGFLVFFFMFVFFGFAFDSQAEVSATTTEETSKEQVSPAENISTTTGTTTEVSTTTENYQTDENQVEKPLPQENLNGADTTKSALNKTKQKRILNLSANISNRLEAVIERHDKIVTRLERRINKIEQTGRDMSETRLELATIKTNSNSAKLIMNEIDFEVYEAVTSDNPQEAWFTPKTSYQNTEKIVLENQDKLIKIVDDLKRTPTTPAQSEETNENENPETEIDQTEQ